MKCFEGENTKDCGCPKPTPTHSALAPTLGQKPSLGRADCPLLSLHQSISGRWGQCRRSGMPRSGWPFVLPCQVRKRWYEKLIRQWGAAGCPLLYPTPQG